MGEGENQWVKLFTDVCYAVCIAIQCWVVLDLAMDGQLSDKAKAQWKRMHAKATREIEIQRQYTHVLFEARMITEGYKNGPGTIG